MPDMASQGPADFPIHRPRRLRRTPALRDLVAQTNVTVNDLIAPLFVREGIESPIEITSLPGVYQDTLESLRKGVVELASMGVRAIMLFGVPVHKDEVGSRPSTLRASSRSRSASCATRSVTTSC